MIKYSPNNVTFVSQAQRTLKRILFAGFVIRLAVLIFILTIGTDYSIPYFIIDDQKYDALARNYMSIASMPFDDTAFSMSGGSAFLQPFWPWVHCIFSYIFRSIYVARAINLILSTLCIKIIYTLTLNISGNEKTSLLSAKLFAFMPISVLTCCFPIKDIFLTFAVLNVFNIFIEFQQGNKISIKKLIFCVTMLVCIYFTRGAVTEMLLLFFGIYVLQRFAYKRQYMSVLFCFLLCVVLLYFFSGPIIDSFNTKISDYSDYKEIDSGISLIRMNSIWQIYKLPFSYFFSTLQPGVTNFFAESKSSFWLSVISWLNISIYPIVIGNFLYIFVKKDNFFFWISTFIMYSSVIYLSLGIFRHYLFLLPVQMINFSLFCQKRIKGSRWLIILGSLGLFALIFGISVISII